MRRRSPSRSLVRSLSLVGALAVLAPGCGDSGGDGTAATDGADPAGGSVLATTTILADITDRVGCGDLDVTSIIPAGTDAHEYEATVQDADRLQGAGLVVANGLGLEEGLEDALQQAASDGVAVLEVGPEVDPLSAAPGEGDGGDVDPHVWMDPDRMATAAGLIADRLTEVDGLPVTDAEIQGCAAAYQQELAELSAGMDATLAAVPADRRKLVTNHEALGYFADRFDFEVIGAIIPSTSSLGETNPRDLEELAVTVRDAGVPAVFGETTQPAEVADQLAELVGGDVAVVELYTETLGEPGSGADTYLTMMRTNADRVAGALGRSSAGPAPGPSTTGG